MRKVKLIVHETYQGKCKSEDVFAAVFLSNAVALTPNTHSGIIKDTYGDAEWHDLLTAFNGESITYDAIGNPLTYRGQTLSWQNGRRLAGMTGDGLNASFTYDIDGNRISKTVNGASKEYIYVDGVLVGESDGTNKLVFLYDESGTKYGFVYNGATYFYNLNLQGDVVGIYDSTGAEVVTYTYDEWGKVLSVTGTLAGTIGQINPIRYRGYYYDNETGLYYVSSRYYDPEVGRWINADGQISGVGGDIRGYNMFAYCFNNPVNMDDPSGHWPKWVKKVIKTVKNIAKSVLSVITNFTTEAGFGTGLRLEVKAIDVNVTAGVKYDALNLKINHEKGRIDLGQEEKEGISVAVKPFDTIGVSSDKGLFHSNSCEYYPDKQHNTGTCPNTIIYDGTPTTNIDLFGVEAYLLIGGSFNVGVNYENVKRELIAIWKE